MECTNCGASLMSSLICEYCGENNAPGKQDEVPDKEEIEFQIELLEDKIRQLLSMPIPQNIKEKKIEVQKNKIAALRDKM
jgi:hypothetical protein